MKRPRGGEHPKKNDNEIWELRRANELQTTAVSCSCCGRKIPDTFWTVLKIENRKDRAPIWTELACFVRHLSGRFRYTSSLNLQKMIGNSFRNGTDPMRSGRYTIYRAKGIEINAIRELHNKINRESPTYWDGFVWTESITHDLWRIHHWESDRNNLQELNPRVLHEWVKDFGGCNLEREESE